MLTSARKSWNQPELAPEPKPHGLSELRARRQVVRAHLPSASDTWERAS